MPADKVKKFKRITGIIEQRRECGNCKYVYPVIHAQDKSSCPKCGSTKYTVLPEPK